MDIDNITLMEHMAAKSPLPLESFCEAVQRALDLPEFEYDAENETEWGISFKNGVEYNVSRPYKPETLREWDDTVPEGFNFGLILIFRKGATVPTSASAELVCEVGQLLATALRVPIAYHCTWLGVGNNVPREGLFLPGPLDGGVRPTRPNPRH